MNITVTAGPEDRMSPSEVLADYREELHLMKTQQVPIGTTFVTNEEFLAQMEKTIRVLEGYVEAGDEWPQTSGVVSVAL